MWKREKEKEVSRVATSEEQAPDPLEESKKEHSGEHASTQDRHRKRQHRSREDGGTGESSHRRRHSRSRSPKHRSHSESRAVRRRRFRDIPTRKHDSGE